MSCAVSSNSVLPEEEEPESTSAAEHQRHKRRRRGKKRKYHKSDKSVNVSDVNENNADNNQTADAADENQTEKDPNCVNKRRPRGILIRPLIVPQAPQNSTQFIIDDHEGCGLYFSFETPNPYCKGEIIQRESHVEPCTQAEDDALEDIDYKYESLQDFDAAAYYTQDFEAAYKTFRYDELMRLKKEDLVVAVENLSSRLKTLEEDLVEYDPNPVLEQLQHKLLSLQEENSDLVEVNLNLKAMFSNESASEQSLDEELSGNEGTECNEKMYVVNVESASEPSIDGNLSETEERVSSVEQTDGQNLDGSVREKLCGHISPDNEKSDYTSMSEKMSNVEIAEPASEHVQL